MSLAIKLSLTTILMITPALATNAVAENAGPAAAPSDAFPVATTAAVATPAPVPHVEPIIETHAEPHPEPIVAAMAVSQPALRPLHTHTSEPIPSLGDWMVRAISRAIARVSESFTRYEGKRPVARRATTEE